MDDETHAGGAAATPSHDLPRWTPFPLLRVRGRSMLPTLRPGDCLVVRPGGRIKPGQLVVATFPAGPDLLVVKRAVRPVDGLWWVESDNPAVTDDSRRYGPAEVLSRVLLR